MARFGSTQAFQVNNKKYKAGQTYADTTGNALAGDVVWATVGTSAGMSPGLVPLDAGATTIMNASRFASTPSYRIDGVNSIDG
ncbi:MAG TPA: hypothetical protein VH187_05550 [Scandinavium sp.]|jgi:hypothetical protein|uniref:hypothetical protein n=1 Tax=Scandinavium sp. TaxID=2830653 RepID=UPI002E36FD25|nr:hypothetical protein [Scandinavium sp.]HEX4500626.1 hypothetical protein [Scandinavium sp.]